ncbi:MAG: FHA domain-containing protein, partial [Oscillospiraceae bacterium]
IKAEVTNQIDTLDKDDKIAVVTFGENVSLVCDAKDTKEQAKEKIKQIKSGENATRLYDGLSQILNYISTNNASLPHRKVVILITDGVDVNKGGATQGEVMSQLDNAGLSLYSLGIDNKAENKYLDSLGELARATGGRNYILESGNVSKSISSVIKFIDNVLCVNLAASNNLVTNAKQELRLDITVDGQVQAVQKKFTVTGWQKDETPPFLASVEVVAGDKLKIDFNEPVELPQKTGVVSIRNAKGKQIKVKAINWQDKKNAEILLEEEIYNGNYEIEINGGCDISMEKNKISVNKMDFEVNTNQKDLGYFLGNYSKIVIFGTVILILLIAGIVTVILINRRKKNSIEEPTDEHTQDPTGKSTFEHKISTIEKGKKLLIFASVGTNEKHKLSVDLVGTLIIGRSEKTSDISFDDTGLSRQHCALLLDGNRVLIQDLESENGTYVNGIRLECARVLNSGDKINISDTEITIEM